MRIVAHKVRNLLSLNRDTGDDEVSRLKELVERLKEEVKSLKTNPNSASDIPPVMSTASSAEVEMLQKDNQSLRRKLEEQKEENLRLRAHRDYLSNELAFVQSEFTLKIRQNSPAPSESALSDVFSDVESVTSYATGVSSIPDTDSNVGGSRIPISKRPMTRPSSLIPRSTTPGTTVPPLHRYLPLPSPKPLRNRIDLSVVFALT
ncbi:hypothetical protein BC829DRAFT_76869 [Chytridium lagenaria]|nr:hypothetical protein BC829DRAFT_76869 [Chytridium lagenaria]